MESGVVGAEELSARECWAHLRSKELGRLAYRLVDEVHLVPTNYLAIGGAILIRTSSGNKLLAAAPQSDAAFEIAHHDDGVTWAVVARGRLRLLDEHEHARLDGAGRSWLPGPTYDVVELIPEVVTGRRFRLVTH